MWRPDTAGTILLPQGLAYEASEANIRRLEEEKGPGRGDGPAETTSKPNVGHPRSDDLALTFHARAGEDGKLFGSVTPGDIADRAIG